MATSSASLNRSARRPDMPRDQELVAEVAMHGSLSAVERAHGWPKDTLGQYLRRSSRVALRATCMAVAAPPQSLRQEPYTTAYPADGEIVAMMERLGSYSAVARELGVRRESLRSYLERRPALRARMDAHRPALLSEQRRDENRRRAAREYMRRRRLVEPATTRARRRLSMAGRASAGRKPALDPEVNEYARILRADTCSYCGAPAEHIDHIVPVASAGDLTWDNLTAACGPCNRAKRTRPLLIFMLDRRTA